MSFPVINRSKHNCFAFFKQYDHHQAGKSSLENRLVHFRKLDFLFIAIWLMLPLKLFEKEICVDIPRLAKQLPRKF